MPDPTLTRLRLDLHAALLARDDAQATATDHWEAVKLVWRLQADIRARAQFLGRRERGRADRSALVAAIAELSVWWDGPGSEGREV